MAQAKTLTAAELRRVTDYIATRPHAARNRAMLMMTHLAGLRVGEVALLSWSDAVNPEGVGSFVSFVWIAAGLHALLSVQPTMLLLAPVGKWPTQRLNPKPIYNFASSCYICSKISFLENLWDYPFESTAIFTIKQNLTHTLSAELFLDKLSFGR